MEVGDISEELLRHGEIILFGAIASIIGNSQYGHEYFFWLLLTLSELNGLMELLHPDGGHVVAHK